MKKPVVDLGPKAIEQIEFGAFSCQDAKRLSVLELYERDLYDVTQPNRPSVKFGVLDDRLGTADKMGKCETCGLGLQDCVGHFGVVRLVVPVFHIGYFKLMLSVLQQICKTCSRILLEEPARRSYIRRLRNPNLDGVQRKEILKAISVACKKVGKCPGCEAINGTVKKVGALKVIHEKFRRKSKTDEEAEFRMTFDTAAKMDPSMAHYIPRAQQDLNPLNVLRLFERITNEDCELLGLDSSWGRPELFLWTALPVPPVCIRPSIGQENSSTEDDLTVLLSEIIEINTKIKGLIVSGHKTESLMEYWDYLQLQCAMYVTSDLPGVPSHLQGNLPRIKKGFCQRLKGKHGRFRGNLSGKRVDFSGRTVISPDPNLRIDQVAVPERVAKILTYPERVTRHNIERLRSNVLNGADIHPGATYITQSKNQKKFLRYGNREKIAAQLNIGDVVDRHLQDGDVVLFNRQPSLHKLSIMSHFVKVRPWRTFRFNECVCTPYNADFDGDEMNLHVPQTEEARAEAMQLMGTKNNLVTPRNGEPLIAATQDFITASYLLSRKDVFYDRAQFSLICSYMSDGLAPVDLPPPAIVKPAKLWTGKQVFNVLLRPKPHVWVNLETKCRTFGKDLKDKYGNKFSQQKTRAGHPIDPSFCPNDGYIRIYNSELISGVVDKSIIGDGNKNSMFYTVMRDYGPETAGECMNRIAKLSARWLANQGFSIGIDDVQPGLILSKEKEMVVEKGYADCEDTIVMSKQGQLPNQPGCNEEQTLEAKLSGILSKIREDVGQSCFQELNKYNAPLIMSLCGSKGSKINVSQMVACVGQQIISGSRIPNGFIDRSLPHFPKNSKTPAAKGFVRNSFYSGLTPSEFFFHAVSGREGLVDTAVKTAETGYMQRRLMKAMEDLVSHYDLSVRDSTGGVVQFRFGDDGLDPANIEGADQPVEFTRNLAHCIASHKNPAHIRLLPWEIMQLAESELTSPRLTKACSGEYLNSLRKFIRSEVVEKLGRVREERGLPSLLERNESYRIPQSEEMAKGLRMSLTREQLKAFFDICYLKYMRAMIEPGTAVGAVGAQSIGEPGTQMTLKTFHFAGVASMNVTLGVPRIKEIINASKKISTPIIDARLISGDYGSGGDPRQAHFAAEAAARVVKGRVERTLLEDVTEYIEEVIAPNECGLKIKLDYEAIKRLQLEVDIYTIRWSLVKSKLKIMDEQVRCDPPDILRISLGSKISQLGALQALQTLKRALPRIIIKGFTTVNRAVINDSEKENRLNLLVEGYGLRDVMATEGIDGTRTKSNHTLECLQTLGIEAARYTIIYEIMYTMKSHGMTIDRRHVMLLADLMTFKGEVLGITRFGIAKMKDSVLMLASFEKTTDHLFEAAFYGKRDAINGVSECIIMGVPMGIGTGLFRLLRKTDEEKDKLRLPRPLLFDDEKHHVFT
ncbi:DNA-directed RNA polymerase [Spizellomyces sp. 'palustris']|nr:DNA-directed RNA polymerase [Spizellomyces sp. 'palustris']